MVYTSTLIKVLLKSSESQVGWRSARPTWRNSEIGLASVHSLLPMAHFSFSLHPWLCLTPPETHAHACGHFGAVYNSAHKCCPLVTHQARECVLSSTLAFEKGGGARRRELCRALEASWRERWWELGNLRYQKHSVKEGGADSHRDTPRPVTSCSDVLVLWCRVWSADPGWAFYTTGPMARASSACDWGQYQGKPTFWRFSFTSSFEVDIKTLKDKLWQEKI